MSKRKSVQLNYRKRVGAPKMMKDKNGAVVLLCPFCVPPHPLQPNIPSLCGTTLQVVAEQVIFRAKFDKRFVCAKCLQGGGEMVQYQNGHIHINDCAPGVMTMTHPPEYSRFAKFVYGLKSERLKSLIEKNMGKVVPVEEITAEGVKTGDVLGYFFYKKEGSNGKKTISGNRDNSPSGSG